MNEVVGILLTLLTGSFFIVGGLLIYFFREKNKLIDFATGLAFSVILGLIIFDLLPEITNYFSRIVVGYQFILIVSLIVSGMVVSKIIDMYIPHHDHDEEIKHNNHESHLYHIGIVTGLSLLLHNILEGTIIYLTTLTGRKEGLILAIGVAAHNIPMGMQIYASLKEGRANLKQRILMMILLVFSGVIGAIIMLLFHNNINNLVLGSLMAFTVGILIYILAFELSAELFSNKKKMSSIVGIICGIILVVISLIL